MKNPATKSAFPAARFLRVIAVAGALIAMQGTGVAAAASHHRAASTSNASCADTDLRPTPANSTRVEAATFCLVNVQRARHGLHALRRNADLARSAARAFRGHGLRELLRPRQPRRRDAARADQGQHLPPAPLGVHGGREHRCRHDAAGDTGIDRRELDEVPRPSGEHPQPRLPRQRHRRRRAGAAAVLERPRAARPTRSSSASSPRASRLGPHLRSRRSACRPRSGARAG